MVVATGKKTHIKKHCKELNYSSNKATQSTVILLIFLQLTLIPPNKGWRKIISLLFVLPSRDTSAETSGKYTKEHHCVGSNEGNYCRS